MGFVQFNGEPGETWINGTGKAQYQWICDLVNTCGACFQLHMTIASAMPQLHHGCNCRVELILPGQQAQPFVDFRTLLDAMPEDQKAAAVGVGNYRLIQQGVVKWEDVVTPSRVRDLREVVAREKLSIDTMTAAGVRPQDARKAYAAVHTPAHQIEAQTRQELLDLLRGRGVQAQEARDLVAQRLAARVSVDAGTSGPQGTLIRPGSPTPPTPPTMTTMTKEQVEKIAGVQLRPATPAPHAPDKPIRERIATWTEGDRIVEAVLEAGAAHQRELAEIQRKSREAFEAYEAANVAAATKRLEWWEAKSRSEKIAITKEARRLGDLAEDLEKKHTAALQARIDAEQSKGQTLAHAALPKATNPPQWTLLDKPPRGWKYIDDRLTEMDFPSPEVMTRAEEARAWLAQFVNQGDSKSLEVGVAELPQGYEGRAHCGTGNGVHVAMAKHDTLVSHIHELGHAIDEQRAGGQAIGGRCKEFLAYRVGNESPVQLNQVVENAHYEDHEFGRKDKFADAFGGNESRAYYTGKEYTGRVSEILAMGVQQLYEDPVQFARGDPEFFKFVVGILTGHLR